MLAYSLAEPLHCSFTEMFQRRVRGTQPQPKHRQQCKLPRVSHGVVLPLGKDAGDVFCVCTDVGHGWQAAGHSDWSWGGVTMGR